MKVVEIEPDEWVFVSSELSTVDDDLLDNAIDMWHGNSFAQAEKLFQKALFQNKYNIDAFHHLSLLHDSRGRELEAYLCCREAARIGLDAFPEKFDWKKSKLDWYSHRNRPFMRAYHFLGILHQRRGELELAEQVFSRLLSVCPNDSLGVRYLLPTLWLEKGDYLSVVRLCKAYSDDIAPELSYTHALTLMLMGEKNKAIELLNAAMADLPLVAKELRKKRHRQPKPLIHGGITHGGADQAYEYWQHYGKFWANCPGALDLLSG